jgi:hypothetical protein
MWKCVVQKIGRMPILWSMHAYIDIKMLEIKARDSFWRLVRRSKYKQRFIKDNMFLAGWNCCWICQRFRVFPEINLYINFNCKSPPNLFYFLFFFVTTVCCDSKGIKSAPVNIIIFFFANYLFSTFIWTNNKYITKWILHTWRIICNFFWNYS